MKIDDKITEKPSHYNHLEKMDVDEVLRSINREDMLVAGAVECAIPQIEPLVRAIESRMKQGGRLTFGVSPDWVIGIIAGGEEALRQAVEHAEDDEEQGRLDLEAYRLAPLDSVIGIAASGTTPYVIGAVKHARANGLLTGCITSNPHTPLASEAEYPIETIVGPEFVTGSSRMKSGTAQKMVLNMISTALMIRMGRVKGNRMVKMQLTNEKLIDRGTRMIQESLGITYDEARQRLLEAGSVDKVIS